MKLPCSEYDYTGVVAQLVEHLQCTQRSRVQSPATPAFHYSWNKQLNQISYRWKELRRSSRRRRSALSAEERCSRFQQHMPAGCCGRKVAARLKVSLQIGAGYDSGWKKPRVDGEPPEGWMPGAKNRGFRPLRPSSVSRRVPPVQQSTMLLRNLEDV